MVPQTSPPSTGRALAIVSLVVALIALLLVILDGACRPDPVPAATPYVPQEMPVAPTPTALKTSGAGEVAP